MAQELVAWSDLVAGAGGTNALAAPGGARGPTPPNSEFGFGGAFIEDTVLVTDSGAKVLTELDRELQVVSG
jgi:hypothetical protein